MAENREKHVIEICAFCCCGSKQISLFYLLLIFFSFVFFCFRFFCCSCCSVRADRPMAELIGVNSNYISLEIKTEELLRFCFYLLDILFCFCYSFRISLQESALVAICCCCCYLFWMLLLFLSCIVNQDYQHILYLHWNRLELI